MMDSSQTCRYCGKSTESLGMIFHRNCGDYLRSQPHMVFESLTDICIRVLREERDSFKAQLWEMDCSHHWGRTLTGEKAHYCQDWDGLPLDETCDAVWPSCHCYEDAASEALKKESQARMDELEKSNG